MMRIGGAVLVGAILAGLTPATANTPAASGDGGCHVVRKSSTLKTTAEPGGPTYQYVETSTKWRCGNRTVTTIADEYAVRSR
jgi:hypothetical protein